MNQQSFKRIDLILGWVTILISFVVYAMTMEPTSSFWDCGEFIASAYKLQVGHPPGAPLFAMIARVFALFAGGDVTKVALMINLVSVTASAFTIGFLFWTIMAIIKKIRLIENKGKPVEWTAASAFTTFGAAFVGAIAYTFTDTFWFSAVEGEVYAMSSWFTAIVFWAMLRWDEAADQPHADRWIILIMYLMGLSIGVHLLNLLTIPALALVYYYRKYKGDMKGAFLTLIISMLIFLFITYGVIPGTISIAGVSERIFTNSFGTGFGAGLIIYIALLFAGLIFGIVALQKRKKYFATMGLWSLLVILIGYSSYGMIGIRSKANTPMDENNPENVFAMKSYLNREQYGSRPLFYGPFYDAEVRKYEKSSPIYIPAYQVKKKGSKKPINSYQIEREAKEYIDAQTDKGSYTIEKQYIVSDHKVEPEYDDSRMTVLPRMWSREHASEYEYWGSVRRGGKPGFGDNIEFLFRYQLGWMYARYFMWNFSGRESDIQGHGGPLHGHWITGIGFVDEMLLGYPQDHLPKEVADNKGRNKYFMLPFIIGLLGAIYHFGRDRKGFIAVLTLFIFTGIMIVFHNNASPIQPRERDYVFAGSFYVYAIWIGLGVLALCDWLGKYAGKKIGFAIVPLTFLLVPVMLAKENWDDHTRANRYTAPDFAYNYLNSCAPNAILFTNGDNDTFPLWYLQEVEGVRTDVRVVNLSLLNTDWYITQMKRAAYDGKAVPFSLTEPEYRSGIRDQVLLNREKAEYYTIQDQMKFLRIADGSNKYPVGGGEELFFFQSNKFIIPVDSANVMKDPTFKKGVENRMVKALPWIPSKPSRDEQGRPIKVPVPYVLKADVMIIDLLSRFNWERPIYFAITVGESNYLGLDDYFEIDGLAYRLVPYRVKSHDGQLGEVNTDVMYDNMINKFKWGNMNKPGVYLDETNLRMTLNLRNNFLRLATALVAEGKPDKALKCLDKTEELMPDNVVAYNYFNLLIADLYFDLGQKEKATKIVQTLKERTEIDVAYYERFTNKKSVDEEYGRAQQILALCNQLLKKMTDPNAGKKEFQGDPNMAPKDSIIKDSTK